MTLLTFVSSICAYIHTYTLIYMHMRTYIYKINSHRIYVYVCLFVLLRRVFTSKWYLCFCIYVEIFIIYMCVVENAYIYFFTYGDVCVCIDTQAHTISYTFVWHFIDINHRHEFKVVHTYSLSLKCQCLYVIFLCAWTFSLYLCFVFMQLKTLLTSLKHISGSFSSKI